MATVNVTLADGLGFTIRGEEQLLRIRQLLGSVGLDADSCLVLDEEEEIGYLFSAIAGEEVATDEMGDKRVHAILQLLAAMPGPVRYGVAKHPASFFQSLYAEIGEEQWAYTASVPAVGNEYYSYSVHLAPDGLWGFWSLYSWDDDEDEYHVTESGESPKGP